jgi:hypothetical protein
MPPSKRQKTPIQAVFVDSSIEPVEWDCVGHPSVCVATINSDQLTAGCDAIYILKREYKELEDPWAPISVRDCYARYDFMDGRIPGLSLWKVLPNTTENWRSVAQKHGWERKIPYVYVIKQNNGSKKHAHLKIGCSFDVEARLKTLQCGNPYKLTILDKFQASDEMGDAAAMFACENKLHRQFYQYGGPFRPAHLQNDYVGGKEWFVVKGDDERTEHGDQFLDVNVARFLGDVSEKVELFRDPLRSPQTEDSATAN